jgi:hypothetical protein
LFGTSVWIQQYSARSMSATATTPSSTLWYKYTVRYDSWMMLLADRVS